MARNSKRDTSGRFAPVDDYMPFEYITDVSGNPEGEHDMPATMTEYPADFTSPHGPCPSTTLTQTRATTDTTTGVLIRTLGSGDRASYRDSAGIPVTKAKAGT